MKIIPYIRFLWAGYIIVAPFFETRFNNIAQGPVGSLSMIINGVIGFTFVLYCVVTGIQELTRKQLIDAKFFYFFGIFFEILIFLAGAYMVTVARDVGIETSRIAMLVCWQVVMAIVVFVDVRRIVINL
jgi:hypothetical protein